MPPVPPLVPRADEFFLPLPPAASPITNDPSDAFSEFIPGPDELLDHHDQVKSPTDHDWIHNGFQTTARRSIDSYTSGISTPNSSHPGRSSSLISTDARSTTSSGQCYPRKRFSVAQLDPSETTSLGGEKAATLFSIEKIQEMTSDNLFMHLYQAVHMVVSVKEAMWEELKERVEENDPTLIKFGWGEEDFNFQTSREKFDALLERYRG